MRELKGVHSLDMLWQPGLTTEAACWAQSHSASLPAVFGFSLLDSSIEEPTAKKW